VSGSAPTIVRNQLLAALPPEVLASLTPKLRQVSLAVRDSLIAPGKVIEAVYFVESGWVSLVTTLEDGTQAEVGLVGQEGMVGLPLISGVNTGFEEAFVQARGAALRMEADAFRRTFEEFPILQARLHRYSEAMRGQAIQTAACNGRHALEQRFARWLLMAHDRSDGDELPVTQEFLALMVSATVPASQWWPAGALQQAGIIRRSRRGEITVLDRRALEATACDCYEAVRHRFSTLLGGPQTKAD
jgi:CRP-like cAMP-binding protein